MPSMLPLQEMTIPEKLQLMEALWADLSKTGAVQSPEWHRGILEEREATVASGAAQFTDWEQAKMTSVNGCHEDRDS
jgi:hypothetical protein